jgi:hypothetical protein
MKKYLGCLMCVLFVVLFFSFVANAEVLFDSASMLKNDLKDWTITQGKWSVVEQDGRLALTPTPDVRTPCVMYYSGLKLPDSYRVSWDMSWGASDWIGIVLELQDRQRYYEIRVKRTEGRLQVLGVVESGKGILAFGKFSQPVKHFLHPDWSVDRGEWVHFEVVRYPDRFVITVDEYESHEVLLSEFNLDSDYREPGVLPYSNGYFGLKIDNAYTEEGSCYKNIVIDSLK